MKRKTKYDLEDAVEHIIRQERRSPGVLPRAEVLDEKLEKQAPEPQPHGYVDQDQ